MVDGNDKNKIFSTRIDKNNSNDLSIAQLMHYKKAAHKEIVDIENIILNRRDRCIKTINKLLKDFFNIGLFNNNIKVIDFYNVSNGFVVFETRINNITKIKTNLNQFDLDHIRDCAKLAKYDDICCLSSRVSVNMPFGKISYNFPITITNVVITVHMKIDKFLSYISKLKTSRVDLSSLNTMLQYEIQKKKADIKQLSETKNELKSYTKLFDFLNKPKNYNHEK